MVKHEMFFMRFYILAVYIFCLRWLLSQKNKYENQVSIKFETSLVKSYEVIITSETEIAYFNFETTDS